MKASEADRDRIKNQVKGKDQWCLAEFCGSMESEMVVLEVINPGRKMKSLLLSYRGNKLYGREYYIFLKMGMFEEIEEEGETWVYPSELLVAELDAYFEWRRRGSEIGKWTPLLFRKGVKREQDREVTEIVDYLASQEILSKRRGLKTTVLHRPGGTWDIYEVQKLVGELFTEAYQHPRFPEYVILFGHHTKERALDAVYPAHRSAPKTIENDFTATQVMGLEDLPFRPTGVVL